MRTRSVAALASATALATIWIVPAWAADRGRHTFTLVAEGQGFFVEEQLPPGQLVSFVSSSPYGASATLNSSGQSEALAGEPYSPVLYSLPGTANGLGGTSLPTDLPGQVQSSYPTAPEEKAGGRGYQLAVQSGRTVSTALATAGGTGVDGTPPPTATATATVTSVGVDLVARAASGAKALDLGAVTIANVSSAASLTKHADGRPLLEATTDVGTITIDGSTTGLSGAGLTLAGTAVPEPITAATLPLLNQALGPAGVQMAIIPAAYTYTDGTSGSTLDAAKTIRSYASGGLRVSVSQTVPSQGTTVTTFTLGRVFLQMYTGTVPGSASESPATAPAAASSRPTSAVPSPVSASVDELPDAGQPEGGGSVASTPLTQAPVPAGDSPSAGVVPEPTMAAATGGQSFGPALSGRVEVFYLVLVVGALAALGSSALMRLLGVRLLFGRHRHLT
jgi:hypothetical protein